MFKDGEDLKDILIDAQNRSANDLAEEINRQMFGDYTSTSPVKISLFKRFKSTIAEVLLSLAEKVDGDTYNDKFYY